MNSGLHFPKILQLFFYLGIVFKFLIEFNLEVLKATYKSYCDITHNKLSNYSASDFPSSTWYKYF